MGVDATYNLKGIWTTGEKEAFEQAAKERSLWDDYTRLTEEGDVLTLENLDRYYGPDYERGWWPSISARLILLKHHFPNTTVYYGSDSRDDLGDELDSEFIVKMWAYWLSPDGMNYRRDAQYVEEATVDPQLERIAREIEDYLPQDPPTRWDQSTASYVGYSERELDAYRMGHERKKFEDMRIVRADAATEYKGD